MGKEFYVSDVTDLYNLICNNRKEESVMKDSKYTRTDLITLEVRLEGYDNGNYKQMHDRISKALDENRTNIRFTFTDKDYLGYLLENNPDKELIKTLEKILGNESVKQWIS